MSVRIRPGDPAASPPVDEALDRVPDQARIRAVFTEDGSFQVDRPARRDWLASLPRPTWSQVVSIVVLGAVALLVLGGLAVRLSGPDAAPVDASATPSASPSTPPAPSPTPTRSTAASAAASMTAVSWQGAALPVSSVAGPRVFTATRAYGFTHDPLGAALAAVHISTHLDPYTGPKVFGPAIEDQVVGAPPDLLATTTAGYESAARARGYRADVIAAGRPVLAPTGEIRAWHIDDYREHRATVQLLVASPQGTRLVYRIPVRWVAGDWAVSLAGQDRLVFDVARADSADVREFRPFTTRGN